MLIGIMGQSRSGKDTMADYLIKKHGFVRVAFSDPMKRFVQDVFEFSDEQVWGPSEKRNEPDQRYPSEWFHPTDPSQHSFQGYLSPRYALQTLGTEWGRHCYSEVWVDYAIRVYRRLRGGGCAYEQKRGIILTSELMDKDKHPDALMWNKINVVISDVRFVNELQAIKRVGGFVVRVKREGATGEVGISSHPSEEEQKSIDDDDIDDIIVNLEGKENFYKEIDKSVMKLQGLSNGIS